jgi:uncharacterized protein YgbK (DUF1537 family)
LLAYYGDDFTGSTDVLEALSLAGVKTVLFVEPPADEQLARYPRARAIGVAGASRMMSPDEMDAELPDKFAALASLKPQFLHYKVCSTFDSSPQIGSIGRAIDIGCRVFQNRFVPLVVGAPSLQRFCVFGNLFARSGLDSPPFRLDRHPTMRHHPVTPMTEADLRVHLAEQADRPIELVDVLTLDAGYAAASLALQNATTRAGKIVLFDTVTDQHLATVGRLVADARQREGKLLFVAGSSGVEYALAASWNAGREGPLLPAKIPSVDRALVVSGSRSPVTARQIAWAVAHGFVDVPLSDADEKLIDTSFDRGHSVVVHTGRDSFDDPDRAGAALGQVLHDIVHRRRVPRVAVVGGDTSGQVARALGIESLEFVGPLEPGAPLCRARSSDPAVDGLEMTFKGGQVGHDDFFATLLRGSRER